jgi:hypothetical protein
MCNVTEEFFLVKAGFSCQNDNSRFASNNSLHSTQVNQQLNKALKLNREKFNSPACNKSKL